MTMADTNANDNTDDHAHADADTNVDVIPTPMSMEIKLESNRTQEETTRTNLKPNKSKEPQSCLSGRQPLLYQHFANKPGTRLQELSNTNYDVCKSGHRFDFKTL
ncbi:hypothetical protein Dimus_015020 [Dionaea muscipula]